MLPFDYDLPEELIRQRPLADRASARLITVSRTTGEIRHRTFRDVPQLIHPGDLLVLNNTRVSALRLYGSKETGGAIEALLLKSGPNEGEFEALMRPGKRLHPGDKVLFPEGLEAIIGCDLGDGKKQLTFIGTDNLSAKLQDAGKAPLPPYIHEDLDDAERYQTVYSQIEGSSAAPTAGLHFTNEILAQLKTQGVETAFVTLNVGLDTFRPMKSDDPADHVMHGEECEISPETAEKIAAAGRRIIAVGTTTVRTLETMAVGKRRIGPGRTCSKLFITPGFEFKVIDAMFTNFHMPRTTMLLMISAFASPEIISKAYAEAIQHRYGFLSFGDSMFIF